MNNLPLFLLPGTLCNHLLWTDQIAEFGEDREVVVANFAKAATIEKMAALIPDAHLTVLPDCGHMSSMEAPSLVNGVLKDLIARAERS